VISPGRLWWLLRRDVKRGWDAAYHDYKTLPRIEEWAWPFWNEPSQTIPVHVLTGRNDWRLAAWMLASWFQFSEHAWPIVIHDDGTLPDDARATLGGMFENARFISRREADEKVARTLLAYPFCEEYRRKHPLALKIFDVPLFTAGERFMIFDSDLLFFNHPREILDWAAADTDECWFNEDVREGSLISASEAREELGVKIWPRVNSGLCLLCKSAIDYDLCDRALALTSIPRGHPWRIEQTLFMLCAAKHGKGGLLPRRYEVSLGKRASEDAVSRHYVGAVRDRFYAEGVKRLSRFLLPQEVK
jgi:hypothetical protein